MGVLELYGASDGLTIKKKDTQQPTLSSKF